MQRVDGRYKWAGIFEVLALLLVLLLRRGWGLLALSRLVWNFEKPLACARGLGAQLWIGVGSSLLLHSEHNSQNT